MQFYMTWEVRYYRKFKTYISVNIGIVLKIFLFLFFLFLSQKREKKILYGIKVFERFWIKRFL